MHPSLFPILLGSILVALGAGVATFLAGGGVLWALAAYSLSGSLTLLSLAATRSLLQERGTALQRQVTTRRQRDMRVSARCDTRVA